jgi:hypothetical protein
MGSRAFGVVLLMCAVFFLSASGPAFCQDDQGLARVYTPERISAFKSVIRYYNPSINAATADRIARAIIFYSHRHKIEDDRFVAAVITIESMFNPYAVSRSGAQGLGQLMPGTAKDLSVGNSFSVEENVDGSCRYLKRQMDRFGSHSRQQRYELCLAAYNAGPGAVQKWGGVPPYTETRRYVVDVINVWRQLCGLEPMDGASLKAIQKRGVAYRQQQQSKAKITRHYIYTTQPSPAEN